MAWKTLCFCFLNMVFAAVCSSLNITSGAILTGFCLSRTAKRRSCVGTIRIYYFDCGPLSSDLFV